jgi:hypothetical protein
MYPGWTRLDPRRSHYPHPSATDQELWQHFTTGLLDDEIHHAAELHLVELWSTDPNARHPYVLALRTEAWTPLLLACGPRAYELGRVRVVALLDERIEVYHTFEYGASGVTMGLVTATEADRLHQLVRQNVVVDPIARAAVGRSMNATNCARTLARPTSRPC